jgi:hypothetical protein
MLTREEAIRRLSNIEREAAELRSEIERGWFEATGKTATEVFLEKCGGWEDDRTPEEIIADIYSSRTSSDRGADLFSGEGE